MKRRKARFTGVRSAASQKKAGKMGFGRIFLFTSPFFIPYHLVANVDLNVLGIGFSGRSRLKELYGSS